MKKKLLEVSDYRAKDEVGPYNDFGWIFKGIGDFAFDSIPNLNLRKSDKKNFAHFHEGNPADNLFYKVKD